MYCRHALYQVMNCWRTWPAGNCSARRATTTCTARSSTLRSRWVILASVPIDVPNLVNSVRACNGIF